MILTSDKLDDWMKQFQTKLVELFASRLKFLGIQGSYGRGEQTATSDIDVVVILDKVHFTDLQAYRKLLSSMEHCERICGFVAGEGELRNWEKSDLLQLVLDTKPVIGSFEDLYMLFSDKDIQRAVLTGACNLYHACSHNYLHARSSEVLMGLYKTARFTVRMKHFLDTGNYIASMRELEAGVAASDDRKILQTANVIDCDCNDEAFDEYSCILLQWTSELIQSLK